jgi:hypothetical protein
MTRGKSKLAEARAVIAELMADFVSSPEPGNPYRLDSVKAAVRLLEKAPGQGWDSGEVFRARLKAGTMGGRFRPAYLGADLEKLGNLTRDLAVAPRYADRAELDRLKAAHAAEVKALKKRGLL